MNALRTTLVVMAGLAMMLMAYSIARGQSVPYNAARLTWDAVPLIELNPDGNVGYRAYQQQHPCAQAIPADWSPVSGDLPSGTLTYTQNGLQENRTYCWYVTAYTPLAESSPSNLVEKYIPFPGATPAPANLLVE